MSLLRLLSLTNVCRNVNPVRSVLQTFKHPTQTIQFSPALFVNVDQQRTYMRKKTIKIPPTKPLNFDYGGDIEKALKPLELSSPKFDFEGLKELEEAEEEIQKLFSLEFADGRELIKKQVEDIIVQVKLHPADAQSLEYIIALQTVLIRNEMRHCLQFRKDKVAKTRLVNRISCRKKHLRRLRNVDYQSFMNLLDMLKIKYTPPDKYALIPIGKRLRRRMAAKEKTFNIYKEKKKVLWQKFMEEREEFEKMKNEELAKIENELLSLGIEPQETLQETINMIKYGVAKVKGPPQKKRRNLLLEKKFKMWEERKQKLYQENYEKAVANL